MNTLDDEPKPSAQPWRRCPKPESRNKEPERNAVPFLFVVNYLHCALILTKLVDFVRSCPQQGGWMVRPAVGTGEQKWGIAGIIGIILHGVPTWGRTPEVAALCFLRSLFSFCSQ